MFSTNNSVQAQERRSRINSTLRHHSRASRLPCYNQPIHLDRWANSQSKQTCQREFYKAFGALVRQSLKGEAFNRDFVELFDKWGSYPYNLNAYIRLALNSANNNLSYSDEIEVQLCDCGHWEETRSLEEDHDDRTYCEACAGDLVDALDEDGDWVRMHRDDVYYWDNEYHTYEQPEDEESYDEDDECEADGANRLRSWGSSSGDLNHDTQTPIPMGVELEVACDTDYLDDCIDNAQHTFCYKNNGMLKRDGSLPEDSRWWGFEIVTAAKSLQHHIKTFGEWTPHPQLRAWQVPDAACGMHIHVDSRAFTAMSLGKFIAFINNEQNTQFIKGIAGRHARTDDKAASYAATSHAGNALPNNALKGSHSSRYRAVNLVNLTYAEMRRLKIMGVNRDCKGDYSTVELRIFRATLKKERLLAQIEFTHALVVYCRIGAYHALGHEHFTAWLRTGDGAPYKHLRKWLGITVPKPKAGVTTPAITAEV